MSGTDFLTSAARFFVKIYFHKKCGVYEAYQKRPWLFWYAESCRMGSFGTHTMNLLYDFLWHMSICAHICSHLLCICTINHLAIHTLLLLNCPSKFGIFKSQKGWYRCTSNGPSKPDRESAARETVPKSKYKENENTGHIPLGEIDLLRVFRVCFDLRSVDRRHQFRRKRGNQWC